MHQTNKEGKAKHLPKSVLCNMWPTGWLQVVCTCMWDFYNLGKNEMKDKGC